MNVDKPSELTWFKSSYSAGDGGQCVEVAACPATIHVRDSKQHPLTGPHPLPARHGVARVSGACAGVRGVRRARPRGDARL
ncbi:DUF397 domain-containing protein [Streptomyces seoulensis]|uniref:DUF397 domain-containing protein n=1 Tax=Streptomyces seoulensis TaxID=73044 RepID=UPI0033B42872